MFQKKDSKEKNREKIESMSKTKLNVEEHDKPQSVQQTQETVSRMNE